MLFITGIMCGCVTDNDDTPNKYIFDEEKYMEELAERKEYLLEYITSYLGRTTCYYSKDGFSIATAAFKMYEETDDETWKIRALNHAKLA